MYFKMFKLTVSLVAIVSILQCSLASPVIDPDKYGSSTKSPTEKLSNEIEVSLKSASKSIEWMVQSVSQLTTSIFKEVAAGIGRYCVAPLLRLELFSMAAGHHLFFPKMVSSALENEHRIIAIATYKMTKKLHAVEEIDRYLTEASEKAANDLFKAKDPSAQLEKLMKVLYENLESLIKENSVIKEYPRLYKEFLAEKRKAEQQSYPPMGDQLYMIGKDYQFDLKKIEERLSNPVVRSMIVTKQFVQTAAKHLSLLFSVNEFDRYSTARWMLAESDSEFGDKLDRTYNQVLEETAENLDLHKDVEDAKVAFFDKLLALIEKEPSLKDKLEVSKESRKKSNYFDVSFLRTDIIPF